MKTIVRACMCVYLYMCVYILHTYIKIQGCQKLMGRELWHLISLCEYTVWFFPTDRRWEENRYSFFFLLWPQDLAVGSVPASCFCGEWQVCRTVFRYKVAFTQGLIFDILHLQGSYKDAGDGLHPVCLIAVGLKHMRMDLLVNGG